MAVFQTAGAGALPASGTNTAQMFKGTGWSPKPTGRVRERSSATGPPEAEPAGPRAKARAIPWRRANFPPVAQTAEQATDNRQRPVQVRTGGPFYSAAIRRASFGSACSWPRACRGAWAKAHRRQTISGVSVKRAADPFGGQADLVMARARRARERGAEPRASTICFRRRGRAPYCTGPENRSGRLAAVR